MNANPEESNPNSDSLISRRNLALRWNCSILTIARFKPLKPLAIHFSSRLLRYRISDIVELENHYKRAGGIYRG